MIQVESFELHRDSIHLLYDGVGWIVHNGEFMQYHLNFFEASQAMDDLILAMLENEKKI